MKKKTDLIWASLLILTAVLFFYLGNRTGSIGTKEDLTNKIEKKDETITALEGKLQQLSDELTSRGIYSYPQAHLVSYDNDSTATVLINLNGRDAIRNLVIERSLIYDYSGNTQHHIKDNQPASTRASIGTLTAHNPVAFNIKEIKNEVAVELIYRSDRNQWHQYLWANRTPGGELKTFWVITNSDSQVIDKHIDEGFPTRQDGYVLPGKINYSDIRMNSPFNPYSYLEQEEKP